MRIFLKTGKQNHTILVTPAVDSDCSDFKNADGAHRQFNIRFKNGEATVPSNLGNYMLDKGLVQSSPIIIQENIASAAALEHRRRIVRHLG